MRNELKDRFRQVTDEKKRNEFLLSLKSKPVQKTITKVDDSIPTEVSVMKIYGLVFINGKDHNKVWFLEQSKVIVSNPDDFKIGETFTLGEYFPLAPTKFCLTTPITCKTLSKSGSEITFEVIARTRWDGVFLGPYKKS